MTLGETEFHCFCCKKKVKAVKGSISFDVYKNGRSAMRGICSVKHCKLSKIISDNSAKTLKDKYSYEIIDDKEEKEEEELKIVDQEDEEDQDEEGEDEDEEDEEDEVPSYVLTSRVPSSHVPSSQRVLSNVKPNDSDNSISVVEIGGFFALVGLLATSIVVGMKTNI